jgi:transposase InsO family protein
LKFIAEHRTCWPVTVLCRVLKVTRAAFYKWLGRKPSPTETRQKQIVTEIRQIHALPRHQDYGSPRIHRQLISQGTRVSRNTVAKLMNQHNIHARNKKKFRVRTTDSRHSLPIAPNRLQQRFSAESPDQIWLTDFTFIPVAGKFSYLCTVQDLCSRKIIGWAASQNIDTRLALAALDQAIAFRRPQNGLIVHSDRGSQYASEAFRKRLADHGFLQSMSRKGNCYDNAPMESFFKSFKVEEVDHAVYESHEQAVRAAADYIERFYNAIRLHSALGYVSPNQFEQTRMFVNKRRPEICLRRSHSSVARQKLATDNGDREADFDTAFVGDFRGREPSSLPIP